MTPQIRRSRVFISYSHQDATSLERLRVHLKPLERDGEADIWDDTSILAGTKWREEIARALESAAVAILLVSADFLASDFIARNELPPLLKAAEEEGATILPIILSPCSYKRHKGLCEFQAFNDPEMPLTGMSRGEREAVFETVVERVAVLLGAPANASQRRVLTRRLRKAKRIIGKRQPGQPRAVITRSKQGDPEMNSYSTQEDTSTGEQSMTGKNRRFAYWLIFAMIGLVALSITIALAIKQSGDRAEGMASSKKPNVDQSSNRPQASQSPLASYRVGVEKGGKARVFDDRLEIHLDAISFDEGLNQYLVSFRLSSANTEELMVRDGRPSSERAYTYPADGRFTIHLLSAEENVAAFSIEELMN